MEEVGLNRAFWTGRRVLLTGHTGFKGSWLLLLLEQLGANVTGISLEPEADNLFDQVRGQDRCTHVACDVRDRERLAAIVTGADPEVILHLAAQPLVRRSYADPIETIETNILGTANVLEAARRVANLRAIVCVTTDKCYENDGRTSGYVESDRLGGHDPYSNSKACAELVTQCFRDSYFDERSVGLATARAGNVIGGGDYAMDRLVPDAVRALSAGQAPELRNPAAVRPWQHVLEPLTGYLMLAQELASEPKHYAKGWNFGPPPEDLASVATVVARLARAWDRSAEFLRQPGDHPHEAHMLTLDSTMAQRELGWKPRLGLGEAIDWTAGWYRNQLRGEDAAELCLAQIQRYFANDVVKAAA